MMVRVFGVSLLPASARKPSAIAAVCRRALRKEKADGAGELNVVFLDRRRMRILNKRFLGHDRDTDVIAFAYAEDPGPMKGEIPFGDVFISAYKAREQAAELGHPVLAEVLVLAAHGTLHLLGYDDSTARERAAMFKATQEITPLRPRPRGVTAA